LPPFRDFRGRFAGVADPATPAPLPSLTPFPNFVFEVPHPPDPPDLGVHPRAQPRTINLAKLEVKCARELEALRDDLSRRAAAVGERIRTANREEPLVIADFQIPHGVGVRDPLGLPEMVTTSQYLYPSSAQATG
jgi:hypothetical protein